MKKAAILILIFVAVVITFIVYFFLRDKLVEPLPREPKSREQVNIPNDFPTPDGAIVTESSEVEGGEKRGLSLVLESEMKVADLAKFYKENLSNNEWEYEVGTEKGNFVSMNFNKGEYNGFLGITESDSVTLVSVTMGVR